MNPPAPPTRIGSVRRMASWLIPGSPPRVARPSRTISTAPWALRGAARQQSITTARLPSRSSFSSGSSANSGQGVVITVDVRLRKQLGRRRAALRRAVQGADPGLRRDRVVDANLVAGIREQLRERDSRALLDDAGIGLVSQPENPDGVPGLEPRLDDRASRSVWATLTASVASASSGSAPRSRASTPKALLSRGKHGPP